MEHIEMAKSWYKHENDEYEKIEQQLANEYTTEIRVQMFHLAFTRVLDGGQQSLRGDAVV